MVLREKWHPKLRERMLEKKLTLVDIGAAIYRTNKYIGLWMKEPERIPVADAIKICELLDIPLREIEDYFTWEGIR